MIFNNYSNPPQLQPKNKHISPCFSGFISVLKLIWIALGYTCTDIIHYFKPVYKIIIIFLKIHGLGVKSYTLPLETYGFTPYDFTPTNIFFYVKTMPEVHFQSILFHSHISCKGLKSLLKPPAKIIGAYSW